MKLKILILSFLFLGLSACSKDNDDNITCELTTIVSPETYENAPSDILTVNDLEINGDCLKINFSSGGCNGNSWEVTLIDSGTILESNPPQRNLRLSLKNEELCYAYITKELTFDISNLKVDGNQIQLNITNSDDTILYEY
ncbi:hypothetical protein KO566_05995 [Flavobacteriaceae bacterium XHP0103]|uniref:hypothetical protein n=1 Tax=Marixanthotalea marina TaxID=2844359 RepID=UPI002989E413|nr:hypothetical protein [Marixanthotalea marina]MBU3821603.1 hypothetical protein [Marixanthotalea marina]